MLLRSVGGDAAHAMSQADAGPDMAQTVGCPDHEANPASGDVESGQAENSGQAPSPLHAPVQRNIDCCDGGGCECVCVSLSAAPTSLSRSYPFSCSPVTEP